MPSKDLILFGIAFLFGGALTGSITTLYYKNKIKAEIIAEQEKTKEIQESLIKNRDNFNKIENNLNLQNNIKINNIFSEKIEIQAQKEYFEEINKLYE